MHQARHSHSSRHRPYISSTNDLSTSSQTTRSSFTFGSSPHVYSYSTDGLAISSNSRMLSPHLQENSSLRVNLINSNSSHVPRIFSNVSDSSYPQSDSTNTLSTFANNLLLNSDIPETSSHGVNSRSNHSISQPEANPHQRFLNRSTDNCRSHLTTKQRTKWIKTGEKAKRNQQLLNDTEVFHWSNSYYESPVHIHYKTPASTIQSLIQTISSVHLFTIDTELDKPTREQPKPIPALIQIQAIHNEYLANIILIEVQHLPSRSTPLFHQIQQLCHLIFSNANIIMAWGEVVTELQPFEQFHLFDLSHVTHTVNIQKKFTRNWNKVHPHTSQCVNHNRLDQNMTEEDDYLICCVDTDDLEEDLNSSDPSDDHSKCICPNTIRPYKAKGAVWSLQKAVQHIFDKALDKSMTLNIWSCGLDEFLYTWNTNQDRQVRQSLTSYAINDLFAPTNIYFYLNKSNHSSSTSMSPSNLNSIIPNPTVNLPVFLIISDSHCKHFKSTIDTTDFRIITQAVSGLQWYNQYDRNLCVRSLILSQPISSLLSTAANILFVVGTNSVRTIPSLKIIEQVEEIVNLIRSNHAHFHRKHNITIITTFPCYKTSNSFPSTASLLFNINLFNELLLLLSERMNFSCLDIHLDQEHIHHDLMHIKREYQYLIYDSIFNHFQKLFHTKANGPQSQQRSREAITRRNRKCHNRLKQKQQKNTLIRTIDPTWKLNELKQFLKYHQIKYARLPEIYHHQLRIQFNNEVNKQHAEEILSSTTFNEHGAMEWRQQQT